jgi:predicted SAM-dependent methyltransferase
MVRLNLGCGSTTPPNWVNVDYAFGARLVKLPFFKHVNQKLKLFNLDWDENIFLHDLRKAFPWDDNTIAAIYSSHTLEHLSKEEGRFFLSECYRVMRQDGIIRIVVPDLLRIINKYSEKEIRADDFITSLGIINKKDKNFIKRIFTFLYHFPHKCMYDMETLIAVMSELGFRAKGMEPFESDIEDIKAIELDGRARNAVIVEGRK